MKYFLTIIASSALILLSCSQCRSVNNGNEEVQPDGDITYFKYEKHGMRSNPIIICKVERQADGRYKAIYQDYEVDDSAMCDASIGNDIRGYIQEGKVAEYKDYYDPGKRVLDGNTWRLEVRYTNGGRIVSGGRVKKPKDFLGVERSIERIKRAVVEK